jgi:glycine cleavage system H protein
MIRYTDSHEWIHVQGSMGTVGITEKAGRELGEVVYAELPLVGKQVKAGEAVVVLESTKAATDVYSPVSGEIVEINQKLLDFIQHINQSPEQEGWLFKIKLSKPEELDRLNEKK